jgi:hypothetical protein
MTTKMIMKIGIKRARARAGFSDSWDGIRGLWKNRKIDAVKYQRDLRRASDHTRV